jgi:hypothetical protein
MDALRNILAAPSAETPPRDRIITDPHANKSVAETALCAGTTKSACGTASTGEICARVQIPIEAGRVFRRDAGQRSDMKPATIPN